MELLGYIMALFIGISLGLFGGGGSILAVPVLAYLFSLDEKVATAYSLFIVGFAALVGGIKQNINNNVDWITAVVFGIPALIGVWIVRHYVIPELPDVLFDVGDFAISRRMGMFGVFIVLMVAAALSMLKENTRKGGSGDISYNYPLILIEGLIVGTVTGLVGAGGGFLIIPALVVLTNLDIKKAIGTSLVIIALKSILGFFLGDALIMSIDWNFLIVFTSITIIGIFLGVYIGNFIDGNKLKKGFGYFILAMSIFMFIIEFLTK
ncbi:sulfite exporter TauE/SafE family protein [Flavobacteriaceae bacterium]|nr:sulfite exporter TauE/SafE family protein [Flavobacteriaceae bacterium]MDC0924190.1 sulfite exporter TauE/SafE family protein [Flavobacteriaceae bacterium]MDC3182120.1 sulfite exporter TauE/SafE family protein [Flavobacteriaceae bacterium]MDC3227843.1 sulfite exporter TauE/SafE family protein [Flavobacteriaceae bacterium]